MKGRAGRAASFLCGGRTRRGGIAAAGASAGIAGCCFAASAISLVRFALCVYMCRGRNEGGGVSGALAVRNQAAPNSSLETCSAEAQTSPHVTLTLAYTNTTRSRANIMEEKIYCHWRAEDKHESPYATCLAAMYVPVVAPLI
jgi:hypothetical protein